MRKPDKARHRRRRTAEQWAALLAEHGESGLSQRAFCRSRGLSVGAFYNAKSRAKAPALLVEERPEGEFIAVSLDPHAGFPVQARWDVELTLGRAWCCGCEAPDVDPQFGDAGVAVSPAHRYAKFL